MLPGSKLEQTLNCKVIYIAPLGEGQFLNDEQAHRLPKDALIYRLSEIIGKWQKPDEGLVASICYAVANDEDYDVKDQNEIYELLFLDDLVTEMLDALEGASKSLQFPRSR